MKIVVISGNYPSQDFIYGDVFVHTRLKEYRQIANVSVIGFNEHLPADRDFVYEGIAALVTNDYERFCAKLTEANADLLICHFIQGNTIEFLLSLKKPLLVFVHGYEALSWKRRLMNYHSPGDFRYLIPYIRSNTAQLRSMRALAKRANQSQTVPIRFIFVSNWVKAAVQQDLGVQIKASHVIPNGIDCNLFAYHPKHADDRKKILLLRSFKARNYANDLAIDAIMLLSKKQFFHELEFTLHGEGYLFDRLTAPLRQFSNVTLRKFFIENTKIPAIHRDHGIFLCPSRADTQGVSMCEAMASGLVPITSPIGGIPEYATDGVSSFQRNTPAEIAASIEYLYYNPEKFLEMSRQARQEIEMRCNLSKTVQQEMRVIEAVTRPLSVQPSYQQCAQCILDTKDDPSITFDEHGVCNYCVAYRVHEQEFVKHGEEAKEELARITSLIKEAGADKPYDCILGLSGGLDSSYVALQAHKLGLRPLAVHFDNGWNSELSVKNIQNILHKLNIPLYTLVVDWEEFRDLQVAFLKASVVDIEMVTDHAIIATLYQLAIKHNIKYILSGTNYVTESILPPHWIHRKADYVHIKALQKKFVGKPLKTYPLLNLRTRLRAEFMNIKSVSILNYLPYNRDAAQEELQQEIGWRNYGSKHYESVFTRFYQGYILPKKFNIDKRKAHLSNLICSGQITREQALVEIDRKEDPAMMKSDYEFVVKKLNMTKEEFEAIMAQPAIPHDHYPVEKEIYDRAPYLKFFKPAWQMLKRVLSKNYNV